MVAKFPRALSWCLAEQRFGLLIVQPGCKRSKVTAARFLQQNGFGQLSVGDKCSLGKKLYCSEILKWLVFLKGSWGSFEQNLRG